MDLNYKKRLRRLCLVCTIAATAGCVAPQPPVPTFWQKLAIPQTGARLRDGLVNRRGNFPGLEKKPPVLAIADPANLDPKKPDMIKAAAEIKQDQDLKKQKIKAIKFLAGVNCGCYDKEGKVEAAFMASLEDCDPDVRKAALEGLLETASNCTPCSPGCCPNCLTKDIRKKLEEIANGCEDGCFKEPDPELRNLAKAALRACPPPAEDPIVPEELIAPEPATGEAPPRESDEPAPPTEALQTSFRLSDAVFASSAQTSSRNKHTVAYSMSDDSSPAAKKPTSEFASQQVTNPEQLVKSKAVVYRKSLGELLIHMPDAFQLDTGWGVIVVDAQGNHSLAKITDVGGRRVLLAIDNPEDISVNEGEYVGLGLVSK